MRTGVLTAAAMTGFAANSLLCRAALRGGAIDAASFRFEPPPGAQRVRFEVRAAPAPDPSEEGAQ